MSWSLPEEGAAEPNGLTPAAQDAAFWPALQGGWWHGKA